MSAGVPRHGAINIVKDIGTAGALVLLDDDETFWGQGGLTPPEVRDELLVGEVAETPLVPYDVVRDVVLGNPLLEADVGNGDVGASGQLFRELCDGLDHVYVAGDVEQETLCDASYAGGRGGPARGLESVSLMLAISGHVVWASNTKERGRAGRRRAGQGMKQQQGLAG